MTIEKKLQEKIWQAVDGDLAAVTPGLCIQAVHRGRLKIDVKMGQTWPYYDLASLTKIMFATAAAMQMAQQRLIRLDGRVQEYLPDWPHRATTIEGVLSHSAGLSWWAPFYKSLGKKKFASAEQKREAVKKILYATPLRRDRKSVYSDLDMILLGFVVEAVMQMPLLQAWQSLPWRERTPSLHFNSGHKLRYPRALYAPTEACPWRKTILRGEVHDDNTWSFGGVSTHAGLFGAIDDVTEFGRLLRQTYRGQNIPGFASPQWVRRFTRRAVPKSIGDWALGFMLPSPGAASCGRYFSPASFGHTGFTGTSLWYDPRRDLLVVILSNRVHPTRQNQKFVALRPLLHNFIVESLA